MTTPTEPGIEGLLLAPCPFCGGPGRLDYDDHDPDGWCVYCPACDYSLSFVRGADTAIRAWNTRPPVPGGDFSSLPPTQLADGWVLVPKEPTEEMVAAFDTNAYLAEGAIATSSREMRERVIRARTKMGYRAMLSAAPEHPDALGIGSVRNRAEGEREASSDPLMLAKEALEEISDPEQHYVISGSPGPLFTAGWNAACQVFAELTQAALLKINEARGA